MQKFGLAELVGSFVICLVLAIVGTSLITMFSATPKSQFRDAAIALGVTDAKRKALRADFETATLLMDREPCNESYRKTAGQSAVTYYETLLERPFIRAKLEMTNRSVCASNANSAQMTRAQEPLSLVQAFHNGLRLPWDCMPDEWRTPSDLALQAKLELNIKSARLTSDALTGTLGLLATTWENSPQARACNPTAPYRSQSDYRAPLPKLAPPRDSWDGRARHR